MGRALVFPRAAWAQPSVATRPELQQTGVYLLLGPREDGEGDRLYIGEGDPIKPRLATHHSGNAKKTFGRGDLFCLYGAGAQQDACAAAAQVLVSGHRDLLAIAAEFGRASSCPIATLNAFCEMDTFAIRE